MLFRSQNYNLNVAESDTDWKVFILPTFDDLYSGTEYQNTVISKKEDFEIHDIRKLNYLLWKANVNFIEVLFSKKIIINDKLDSKSISLVNDIFNIKDDLAKLNLPYLYGACIGMSINKIKLLDKPSLGNEDAFKEYGFDTKNALHSFRILDFLERFEKGEFNNFQDAIRYNDNDRELILKVRKGYWSKDEIISMVTLKRDLLENTVKDKYLKATPNEDLNNKLLGIIKDIVKLNI